MSIVVKPRRADFTAAEIIDLTTAVADAVVHAFRHIAGPQDARERVARELIKRSDDVESSAAAAILRLAGEKLTAD